MTDTPAPWAGDPSDERVGERMRALSEFVGRLDERSWARWMERLAAVAELPRERRVAALTKGMTRQELAACIAVVAFVANRLQDGLEFARRLEDGDTLDALPPETVDLLLSLLEDIGRQLHREGGRLLRESRPPTDQLPSTLYQQTFPEAKALAIALADAKKLRRWKELDGDLGLWHQVEQARLQTVLRGNALLDWLGLPATVESLREELCQAGLPAVLLLHTVIASSLERAEKNRLYVTVAVDDLLTGLGWKPRSAVERETMRRKVWRWLALFDAAQIVGRRPGKYRDPDTKQEIDLTSLDALIRITGQRKPAQLAFDNSAPPLEVTYAAGPWIEQWRGNRMILSYFGDVRRLATIPAGKPSGAWAQAIGLALHQKWRERSSYAEVGHVGDDKALTVRFGDFTRRDLLDLFPPDPSVDEVLGGPNPGRAREYWRDAVTLLKQNGVIGYYRELGKLADKRQGWQDAWLDQALDVRPTEDGKQAAAEIAQRSRAIRQGRAKRKANKVQASLELDGVAS